MKYAQNFLEISILASTVDDFSCNETNDNSNRDTNRQIYRLLFYIDMKFSCKALFRNLDEFACLLIVELDFFL